jgi:hypothetical protein
MAFLQGDDFLGINAKIERCYLVKMDAFGRKMRFFVSKKTSGKHHVTKNSLDTRLDLE